MQADALSRFIQDHVPDREDNRQLRILGPQHFNSVAAAHYKPASTDTLGDRICPASQREAEVLEGLKSIDKKAPKALTDGTALWEEEDGDMTSIFLACRFAHFTVSLRFSLTYTFLSFWCLGPLPCASANLPLHHFTVVPLSLALLLLTLVTRPLHIPLLYNTCIYT